MGRSIPFETEGFRERIGAHLFNFVFEKIVMKK